MRNLICSLAFLAFAASGAAAEPLTIQQDRDTNLTVITTPKKDLSDIKIEQNGRVNGITSVQTATENSIKTSQSGWRNTVVIYQEGWIDQSSVVQQAPAKKANQQGPTSYQKLSTEDGFLTYFQTGGFSLVTITGPGNTITSRFGRSR